MFNLTQLCNNNNIFQRKSIHLYSSWGHKLFRFKQVYFSTFCEIFTDWRERKEWYKSLQSKDPLRFAHEQKPGFGYWWLWVYFNLFVVAFNFCTLWNCLLLILDPLRFAHKQKPAFGRWWLWDLSYFHFHTFTLWDLPTSKNLVLVVVSPFQLSSAQAWVSMAVNGSTFAENLETNKSCSRGKVVLDENSLRPLIPGCRLILLETEFKINFCTPS